jgi:hypothetical protein
MAYSEEEKLKIVTDICNNVIEERISFNQAVEKSGISLVSFYMWLTKNVDLQNLYNYAREIRSDVLFEEIIEIADKQEEGEELELDGQGNVTKVKRGDMAKQRQMKIDARKWVVAKMQPKKYGDKLDLTTNNESLNTQQPMTIEQARKLLEDINKDI